MPLQPPELTAEIDRRLDGLLPPRNRTEALSLYTAGDSLLQRLPTSGRNLTPKQAAAVIRTAALVNGPNALSLLTGFAGDARVEVQRELTEVWRYFDPEEYARQVLHDAPLDQGRIAITQPALLSAATWLQHLTAIRLDCETAVDLATLGASPHLTRLGLIRNWRGSTAALIKFPGLRALMLSPDRQITAEDVRPLTGLPELRRLWLYSQGIEQDAVNTLAELQQLTELHIHLAGTDTIDLSALTQMPNLRLLGIAGHGTGSLRNLSSTSLSGLSLGRLDAAPTDPTALAEIFPMITELQLYGSGWPEDLAFVAEFPQLAHLSLDHEMTNRTGGLRVPAALRRIDLGFTTAVDLTPLAGLPQLQRISLRYITEPVDMTPLRRWDGDAVTITTTPDQRLAHRNELPPTVRIRRHETNDLRYD